MMRRLRVKVDPMIVDVDKVVVRCPECHLRNFIAATPEESSGCDHFFAVMVDENGAPVGSAFFEIESPGAIGAHLGELREREDYKDRLRTERLRNSYSMRAARLFGIANEARDALRQIAHENHASAARVDEFLMRLDSALTRDEKKIGEHVTALADL